MATAAAVMHSGGCPASAIHAKTAALRAFTYSGLGVVIEQAEGDSIVVRRVLPGSPAEGALRPGMRITAVDGARYSELADWSDAIRGVPGSDVELEVRMGCHSRAITLTRDVVRMAY
jgi:C-terminal processing protease CtpA/Prc